jgi:hypothetical protein
VLDLRCTFCGSEGYLEVLKYLKKKGKWSVRSEVSVGAVPSRGDLRWTRESADDLFVPTGNRNHGSGKDQGTGISSSVSPAIEEHFI